MHTTLSRITRVGLLCAAMGGAVFADSPRLGLTAGAAWPTGPTRDTFTDSAGYTLGGFADWEQRPGHIIRLALDSAFYPHSNGSFPQRFDGDNDRAQSQELTLNYVFAPRSDLQGFYLVGGLGAMNLQRKSADYLFETGVKLAWTAGFGVDINEHWGILARYHSIQSEQKSLGSVTAGLTYKF